MKITLKNQITDEKVVFEHHNVTYVISKVLYEARQQMQEYVRENDLPKFEIVIRKGR